MKKIALIALSLALYVGISAQGVNFQELTLSEAIAQAKNNQGQGPDMVFFYAYTTWCGPCRNMTNNVFPQQVAGDFFNNKFVSIKVDMERGDGPELAQRFGVRGFPTFLIFNSNGDEIARIVGGANTADAFVAIVRAHVDPAYSPEALRAIYEANKTFDNATAYMDALIALRRMGDVSTFMNAEFMNFPVSDRFSENFWRYAVHSMSTIDAPVLSFVIENKSIFDGSVGRSRVNEALITAYRTILFQFVSGETTLSRAQVDKATTALSLLNERNPVLRFYILVANHFAAGEMDRISSLFNPGAFHSSTTPAQQTQIERLFTSVQGMPRSRIREYFSAKADIWRRSADNFERQVERFND
jgi:thiol-disulfide isomerase/thioredoxin